MRDSNPSQLANSYILLDLIGVGGMAEVYRCKLVGQKGFEKIVVLKKLLPQVAQDAIVVENFIDEARLAALLQHENIAHIYDFGELDGSYFIAMEYLFGKDLYTIIQQAKETGVPIGVENSLLIASRICEGMEYAHTLKDLHQKPLNIIHRDLSPHNVFVTYEGKVKIIDFGIAKAELFDNRTKAGVIKGKISYMSPEQLTDNTIDLRSDIFSIGILLYEMLSGQRMFQGDTATLIRKCMQVDYERLEDICPDLHPGVHQIVQKALQKDVEQRFQTCAEMREAIEDCLFTMQQRPSAQMLKEYVLHLFSERFEYEKQQLMSTIERAEGMQSSGKDQTAKNGSAMVLSEQVENTKIFHVNPDATIVTRLDALSRTDDGSSQKKPREGVSRGAVYAGVTLGCLLLLFFGRLLFVNDEATVRKDAAEEVIRQVVVSDQQKPLNQSEQTMTDNQEVELPPATDQAEISNLINQAEQAIRENRLTIPEDDSALAYYEKVLEIAPDNNVARDGLRHVSEKFAEMAERDLADKKVIEAQANVQKGLAVYPQSDRLSQLSGRIVQEKQQLIQELSAKAQRSMKANNLTSPAEDCAYKYYQDILKFDNDSVIVREGMERIANRYADLADQSFKEFNLAGARVYVAKGLRVQPDHRRLRRIEQELSQSKPETFFKAIEKNIHSIIN